MNIYLHCLIAFNIVGSLSIYIVRYLALDVIYIEFLPFLIIICILTFNTCALLTYKRPKEGSATIWGFLIYMHLMLLTIMLVTLIVFNILRLVGEINIYILYHTIYSCIALVTPLMLDIGKGKIIL